MAIRYTLPGQWIRYDQYAIFNALVDAKATVAALKTTPFQRDWVDQLQALQLKMEVAGTSRIEGAEFSDFELDEAIAKDPVPSWTRAQRQAGAAASAYRWIAKIPDDMPIQADLVCEIHRRIVTGCDDDHCEPGALRATDHNVTFGIPPHRGCEGGSQCEEAFKRLMAAVRSEFRDHDPLVQAMALHYHFASMHPFGDGNGRTARAVEALLLQRAGLRDTAFIAMSNYYHEEKEAYLRALSEVRAARHDLTPFLVFALRGVKSQCDRLLREVKIGIKKAVFRNTMYDLFGRLKSPKRRVIAKRQLEILKQLLSEQEMDLDSLLAATEAHYRELKNPNRAAFRDLNELLHLGAIRAGPEGDGYTVSLDLDWPTEIRESEFSERLKRLPRAKTHSFLGG